MKNLITFLGVLCFQGCVAQQPKSYVKDNGVYLSANDFENNKLLLPFNKGEKPAIRIIEPFWHAHQIWVKTEDSTYRFYYDAIWGYRAQRVNWRVFNGEAYIVKYAGKICLYEMPVYSSIGSYYQDYFSATINSPIREVTRSDLLEVYHSNKIFTDNIKERGGYRTAFIWDKWHRRYVCEEWL